MDKRAKRVPCEQCPLRGLENYREFSAGELDFVADFKSGELDADAGTTILVEGTHSPHLYTVLEGWAFRYKMLEDGRRQILNFLLPGDLVGLQTVLMGEMQHSVEALTPVRLCVFERQRTGEIFTQQPSLAFDLTWLASREERILDENLLSIGRRSALERAAYLLAFIYQRAHNAGVATDGQVTVPITQQHVADTLGLSIVHTNKTLRKLADRGLVKWRDRAFDIYDQQGLLELSGWDGLSEDKRPFI